MATEPVWRGKRVLIVEDEAIVAMMLEDMLADMGCDIVATVATLDEALQKAAALALDFAVLDLNLGGAASYPVADALAERRVPIVFSTGYAAGALPARFRGVPCLAKPFPAAELERAVAKALREQGSVGPA